jgi:hypothetical protein
VQKKVLDETTQDEDSDEARAARLRRYHFTTVQPDGEHKRTLRTELEDGSVAFAELRLDDDGTVALRWFLTSPDTADVSAFFNSVRSKLGAGLADAWENFIYAPNNWLQLSEELQAGLRPGKPGRKGAPIGDLAILVERYVAACAESDKPMELLLTRHYPDETKPRLNKRLRRAQELGLFTGRPGRGKAGGEMTDTCWRLLAEARGEADGIGR